MVHPMIGKPAPPLTLPNIPDGTPFTLPIGEKPIALFFFPAAFTTGCTKEACQFRDAKADNVVFKRNPDLEVVGISGDDTAKQSKFSDQYNLNYPIVSDPDEAARKAYKVSRALMGVSAGRETFLIDAKGIIRDVADSVINWSSHIKMVEKGLVMLEKEAAAGKS